MVFRARKKLKFKVSICQVNFIRYLPIAFLHLPFHWMGETLSGRQVVRERYLPILQIYLSCTTGWQFSQALVLKRSDGPGISCSYAVSKWLLSHCLQLDSCSLDGPKVFIHALLCHLSIGCYFSSELMKKAR